MKKILLTVLAASIFSLAVNAQDKDTTRTESNQFRNTEKKETTPADEAIDSASTDFQQGVNNAVRDAEKAGENVREGVKETGEDIKEGAERTGDKIEQKTEKAGDEIKKGMKRTDDQMERRSEKAVREMKQDPDRKDNSEGNKTTESADPNQEGTANYNAAPEIEVVEAKEGPDNQVVYKYQGGFYYVDREEMKLVKIEESKLQDTDQKMIIKGGKKNQ